MKNIGGAPLVGIGLIDLLKLVEPGAPPDPGLGPQPPIPASPNYKCELINTLAPFCRRLGQETAPESISRAHKPRI